MQVEATDAFDITQEPEHIFGFMEMGPEPTIVDGALVERGVRFVQTWQEICRWDSHSTSKPSMPKSPVNAIRD